MMPRKFRRAAEPHCGATVEWRCRKGMLEKPPWRRMRQACCVRPKENQLGIIGSILRRRDSGSGFRTIDGGHPAPYPDMTDEQLYNYEMTFNVAHKTFDRPPFAAPKIPEEPLIQTQQETWKRPANEKVLDSTRFSARRARVEPQAKPRVESPVGAQAESPAASEAEPQTEPYIGQQYARRHRHHDAQHDTRHNAQHNTGQREPQCESRVPPMDSTGATLDLSRPVRLVTTRQPVEIITTRARHPVYKVHGYVGDADVATVFTLDGRLSENGPCYLENVPEQRQLYLNIYLNDAAAAGNDKYLITQHDTREQADAAAGARVASVVVELDL
jgi:hypothetical protein